MFLCVRVTDRDKLSMASAMKIVFGLLTFVTVGMIIGALLQLAFIRKLEDSYGSESSFRKKLEGRIGVGSQLTRGYCYSSFNEC